MARSATKENQKSYDGRREDSLRAESSKSFDSGTTTADRIRHTLQRRPSKRLPAPSPRPLSPEERGEKLNVGARLERARGSNAARLSLSPLSWISLLCPANPPRPSSPRPARVGQSASNSENLSFATARCIGCWHPSGARRDFPFRTGGIAALNPRLMARTPTGVL